MKWKETLNTHFETRIKNKEYVREYYKSKDIDINSIGIHLAIFTEPFLSLLVSGDKTIESRFSINKVPAISKGTARRYCIYKEKWRNGYWLFYRWNGIILQYAN